MSASPAPPASPPRSSPRTTLTPASPTPPSPPLVHIPFPPSPTLSDNRARSRSPSPARSPRSSTSPGDSHTLSPRPSTSALAQAGLGLLSVPGSPAEDSSDSTWPSSSAQPDSDGAGPRTAASSRANSSDGGERVAGDGSLSATEEAAGSGRGRKISFGTLLGNGRQPSSSPVAEPTPRKLSGPQKLLRRARSFGTATSPLLPSASAFAVPDLPKDGSNSSSSRLPPTPPLPSPPLPTRAYDRRRSSSSKRPDLEVFPPAPQSARSCDSSHTPWLRPMQSNVMPQTSTKGKEKEAAVDPDVHGVPGGRRKSMAIRRSTFSIFRRNDTPALPLPTASSIAPAAQDRPSTAPSQPTSIPSLPSLPSLRLSDSPYRMSWGFGPNSTSSPPNANPPIADLSLTISPLASPANSPLALRPQTPPPARRANSAESPTLRRNGSWAGSGREEVTASPNSDYATLGLWLERNGSPGASASPPARKLLTRAGRSNSDGLMRHRSVGARSAFDESSWPRISRSQSGSTLVASAGAEGETATPPIPIVRPPSPLKTSTSASVSAGPSSSRSSGGLGRRPTTPNSLTDGGSRGMFGAVSGFFSGGGGGGSSGMSRSSSGSSAAALPHEASEFGALFGGSPAKNRKRGLSVGNGIFGSSSVDSRKRAGSSSSLSNSWVPPSGGLLVPTPDGGTTPTGLTRHRASTEPRRLSSSSDHAGTSYFPPNASASPSRGLDLPRPSPHFSLPSPPESLSSTRRSSIAHSRPSTSPPMSRKASFSQGQPPPQGRSRSTSIKVEQEEGETPEGFVRRLTNVLNKGDVARVCASK